MATTFGLTPAKRHHCGQMARMLREEHARALIGLGAHYHREIVEAFEQSTFCVAFMIDGKLAALGGLTGTLLSAEGHVWLALSNEACRHPIAVTRAARRQIIDMMQVKRRLFATVLDGDHAVWRFAAWLGFSLDPFETKNAHRRGYFTMKLECT